MNSSKPGVRLIADVCKAKGIRYAVFSPGSRSAPLVIAFSQIPKIECIVIPDERVAGYFALGLAQQTQNPVAVICTSGTAVLNLGPALCEAYYQHIPMLFLTADRPEGAAERGENQAINQAFLFKHISNASYDVDGDATEEGSLHNLAGQIESAIQHTKQNVPGPVHVNVRLSEPLYEMTAEPAFNYEIEAQLTGTAQLSSDTAKEELGAQLAKASKKMLVVGMRNSDKLFTGKIKLLSQREDVVVLTETTSNTIYANAAISNYDACLDLITAKALNDFAPDIVITFGNQIISKKIRL